MDVFLVQLPSPPYRNVFREWAGGIGTALRSERPAYGHDQKFYDIPFSTLLYVAARLRDRGIEFAYADLQSEPVCDLDRFWQKLADTRPKVLVTVINIPSYRSDLDLLAQARALLPEMRVILIGGAAKWSRADLLMNGHADLVMEEGEELLVAENAARLIAGGALSETQGCSIREGEAIRRMPALMRMKDLNFVEFPAYDLLDFSRYESDYYFGETARYMTVFTSKGCPYNCSYCPYPFGFGERLIYRAPERVGADMERLVREYGVEQILFRDQVFTLNRKHARAVCEEIIRRNLGIRWICETRYDLLDEDLLDVMYRSGCREIHFGLESADEGMFAGMAKPDGPKSLDLFEQVIAMVKARGIVCHVHMIVGMPDESWTTVRHSIAWLRKARPDSAQFSYFMPYPGTPIYDELCKTKELGDVSAIDWEALGGFDAPVIPTRHMTVEEVKRARYRMTVQWRHTLRDRVVRKVKKFARLVPA